MLQTESPENPHNRSMFPSLAPIGSVQNPTWMSGNRESNDNTDSYTTTTTAPSTILSQQQQQQQQQHWQSQQQQHSQSQQQSASMGNQSNMTGGSGAGVNNTPSLPTASTYYTQNPYTTNYMTQIPTATIYQSTPNFPSYAHTNGFDAASQAGTVGVNGLSNFQDYTYANNMTAEVLSSSSIAVTNPFAQHNRSNGNSSTTNLINSVSLPFTTNPFPASMYPNQHLHQLRYSSASPTPSQLTMHYTLPQQQQQQYNSNNIATIPTIPSTSPSTNNSNNYQSRGTNGNLPPHHIGLGPPPHTIPPHKVSSYSYRLQLEDRPFKCDQCVQSFNRNHDLKRHKRIHLAVKPFPCHHCDKSFSRKDALKRHILVKGCGNGERQQRPASASPSTTGRSLPPVGTISTHGSYSEPNSATFPSSQQQSLAHGFPAPTSAGLLEVFSATDSDSHSV